MLAKLDNEVIFKKAFTDKFVLESFVKDIIGIDFEANIIETEKQFEPKVAYIDFKLDIYAESADKRIVVELQRVEYDSHFDRFLGYFLSLILQQQKSAKKYKIQQTVYGIILLVEPYRIVDRMGTAIQDEVLIVKLNPTNLTGEERHIYDHQLHFLNPYHRTSSTPVKIKQWLDLVYSSIHKGENPDLTLKTPAIEKVVHLIEVENLSSEEMHSMKIKEETRIKKQADEDRARAEGKLEGKTEGEAIGIQKGKIEEKIEGIVKALKRGKLTIEEIAEDFDVTIDFVLTIKTENKL